MSPHATPVRYVLVSIVRVPLLPVVFTKPFEVRLDALDILITFVPENVLLSVKSVEEEVLSVGVAHPNAPEDQVTKSPPEHVTRPNPLMFVPNRLVELAVEE
jgi:hypothetical protein